MDGSPTLRVRSLARQVPRALLRRGLRLAGRATGDEGQLLCFYDALGYVPNVLRPHTFNEKTLRLKLSAESLRFAPLADKVRARDYVRERVGAEVLNEVYCIANEPEAICFDRLPSSFVVKANHGSGWNILVPDKSQANEVAVREQCRRWLAMRFGADTGGRWYAALSPRILVERFLHDERYGVPLDYKFWTFHGTVRFVQVDLDRFGYHRRTFYDRHWSRQPFGTLYPPGPAVPRPTPLGRMIAIAECLGSDLDFVRVDLYAVNDAEVVFGELTFAHGAGLERFIPDRRYDRLVGEYW